MENNQNQKAEYILRMRHENTRNVNPVDLNLWDTLPCSIVLDSKWKVWRKHLWEYGYLAKAIGIRFNGANIWNYL